MASLSNTSSSNGEEAPKPASKRRAAIGGKSDLNQNALGRGQTMESAGSVPVDQETEDDGQTRKVLYSHLKDMAIDALELSGARDQQAIAQSIGSVLSSFDMQPETADVLASMVVAAYSCAQELHDEKAVFLAYSCFTDAQLERIVKLARAT